MKHPTESDEWLEELVDTWTEMYKKSMVTLAILREVAASGWVSVDEIAAAFGESCLLYTSDAADDLHCVDHGGRRLIKKKNNKQ